MRHKEMKAMTGIIFVITHDNFSTYITEYTAKRTRTPFHTIETWGGGGADVSLQNGQCHTLSALTQ